MTSSSTSTITTTTAAAVAATTTTVATTLDDGRSLIEEAKRLLRLQVRVFYSDECVMLLDALLTEEKSMRADDVAELMQLPVKHVTQTLQLLCKERLIHSHSKEEASKYSASAAKSTSLFYYVNYREAVDTLRWRLHRLKMSAAETLLAGDDSYRCPRCDARYGALDVARLLSLRDHLFHCARDDAVLLECHGDSAKAKQLEMRQQFNRLLKPLHDGVRALEGRVLPHVEWPFELRRRNDELQDDDMRRSKAESEANRVDGIPTISVEILPSDDMAVDASIFGGTGRGALAATVAPPNATERVRTLPPWLQPIASGGASNSAGAADVDSGAPKASAKRRTAAALSDDDRFMVDSVYQWLRDARGWQEQNNVELADLDAPPPDTAGKKLTDAQAKNALRLRFLRQAKAHDTAKNQQRARFVQEFMRQRLFVCGGDWQVRDTAVLTPELVQELNDVRMRDESDTAMRNSLLVQLAAIPDDTVMTDEEYARFGHGLINVVNDFL
jgi:transcription initiation factor IIE alpha subunit